MNDRLTINRKFHVATKRSGQPSPRYSRGDTLSAQNYQGPRFDQRSRHSPNRQDARLEQATANVEGFEENPAFFKLVG